MAQTHGHFFWEKSVWHQQVQKSFPVRVKDRVVVGCLRGLSATGSLPGAFALGCSDRGPAFSLYRQQAEASGSLTGPQPHGHQQSILSAFETCLARLQAAITVEEAKEYFFI